MPLIALYFVLVVAAAVLLRLTSVLPPLAFTHAVLAAAAVPLMLGAIVHLIPVLTRSHTPSPALSTLPWLAALSGMIAAAVFAGGIGREALPFAAGLLAAVVVAAIFWVQRRMRRALGAPHPGGRWYLVALLFLLLGCGAVFGMAFNTPHFGFWRKLHLHINLFGWIGLTALGTLPVLLPTVVGSSEPHTSLRLQRDLPLAGLGAFLIAAGAASGWPWLALAGVLILIAVPLAHLRAWSQFLGLPALMRSAPASLALATVFFILLALVGALHGFAFFPAERMLPAFVFGFLLPLVMGAMAHLLPVWRFPGPESPARLAFRQGLMRHAMWRGALCALAGVLQLAGFPVATALAAAGVCWFLAALARHWRAQAAEAPGAL